jgi:hypothetical protein
MGSKPLRLQSPVFIFALPCEWGETVGVRDTKDEKSPTLSFTHDEWRAFIQGVKNSEFDL